MVAAREWGARCRALVLVVMILGCGGSSSSSPAPPAPGPLAQLGELATQEGPGVSLDLSPAGGQFALPGGAVLHVPAGALSQATKVTVARSALSLDHVSFYVAGSFAYQLSANRDVERISPPLRLEVPGDPAQVAIGALGGTGWAKRSEYTGGTSAVLIDHFSEHAFAFVQPTPALSENPAVPAHPDEVVKVRAGSDYIRDHANQWEKEFLGIGEVETPMAHCEALKRLIDEKRRTWDFRFPADVISDPLFATFRMGKFLFTSKSSTEVTGPEQVFWQKTMAAHARIKARVLASSQKLSPAQLLQVAVEESGNNAAMGILAAHNFLKQTTNEGRDMILENFGNPFTGEISVGPAMRANDQRAQMFEENAQLHGGEVASKLRAWRNIDRSPSGAYDKMGPLYHVFAAMTAATFMPHINGGAIAVAGEAAMRASGITGDVADFEKAQADFCGKAVGEAVVELFEDPTAVPGSPDAGASPDAKPPVNTAPTNLTCGMKPWNGDRCFFLRETPRLHCAPAGAGAPRFTYTWQEYKKAPRYWFLTVSYFGYLGKFVDADNNTGKPRFDCEGSSVSEVLACLVAARNAETSDCREASSLGQTCSGTPWVLTDICGKAQLSQMNFPQGTANFDEIWAFIKAHADSNGSTDTMP